VTASLYRRGRRDMLRWIIRRVEEMNAKHHDVARTDADARTLFVGGTLYGQGLLAALKRRLEVERMIERTPIGNPTIGPT
jgi:hypothetical protein